MAEIDEKDSHVSADRDSDLPIPDILPVLPLKDVVVFPFIILPLSVSREKSINAVDAALAEQRIIMLVAQRDAQNDSRDPEDLYPVGTVAAIMRMLKLPDGRIRLLVQGLSRARIDKVLAEEPYLKAKITPPRGAGVAGRASARAGGAPAQRQAEPRESVSLGKNISPEVMVIAGNLDDPGAARRPRRLEPRPEARGRPEDPRVHRPDRAPARSSTSCLGQGDQRPDDAAGDLHAGARRDGQVASASTTCASSCKAIQQELGEGERARRGDRRATAKARREEDPARSRRRGGREAAQAARADAPRLRRDGDHRAPTSTG